MGHYWIYTIFVLWTSHSLATPGHLGHLNCHFMMPICKPQAKNDNENQCNTGTGECGARPSMNHSAKEKTPWSKQRLGHHVHQQLTLERYQLYNIIYSNYLFLAQYQDLKATLCKGSSTFTGFTPFPIQNKGIPLPVGFPATITIFHWPGSTTPLSEYGPAWYRALEPQHGKPPKQDFPAWICHVKVSV